LRNTELLTREQILAEAASVLIQNNFSVSSEIEIAGIDKSNQRVFEDAYCVGLLAFFEDFKTLKESWVDIQTSLVEKITSVLSQSDRKSWDVYLVLFTTGFVSSSDISAVKSIKYDTNRVRKLLSTGEDLRDLSDVGAALLPLMPIVEKSRVTNSDSVLKRLPEILEANENHAKMIRIAVEAFESQESISSALYRNSGGA
jgi:hypothetical protein